MTRILSPRAHIVNVEVDAVGAVRWRRRKNCERRSSILSGNDDSIIVVIVVIVVAVLQSSTTDASGRPCSLPQSSGHVAIVVNGEAAMIVLTARRLRRRQVVNFIHLTLPTRFFPQIPTVEFSFRPKEVAGPRAPRRSGGGGGSSCCRRGVIILKSSSSLLLSTRTPRPISSSSRRRRRRRPPPLENGRSRGGMIQSMDGGETLLPGRSGLNRVCY